jgi:predicted negative regulator of RcsB-dependent stress response
VEVLKTEEEQIEAIKRWLRENGSSIVVGIVLGLGAVFGWRGWTAYQQHRAGEGSLAFERLMAAVQAGQPAKAQEVGERILHDYGGSAYAFFSAMMLSRVELDGGDLAAARSRLEWAMRHLPEPSLEPMVRLRLAAVVLAQGQASEALQLVDRPAPPTYAAGYEELKGDIRLALGDHRQARTAYEAALAAATTADRARIQMKLDDLPAESKS